MRNSFCMMLAIALYFLSQSALAQQECPSLDGLAVNQENSVYGVKEGHLFAYVDLSAEIDALACWPNSEVVKAVLAACLKAATAWWAEPRFAAMNTGTVLIITILDKDEYARADFNSALRHGQIDLARTSNEVTVSKHSLDFTNVRKGK